MFQKRIDAIREKLANIERDTEDMRLDTQSLNKPARHGTPWTEFEKINIIEAFNHLVDDYATKYGRMRLDIILFIHSHISRSMR